MKVLLFLMVVSFATACKNNNATQYGLTQDEILNYTSRGDSLVKITFDTLRSTLLGTIQEKGIAGAVRFCHVQALGIISIYDHEDLTISRLTDKPRNPDNKLADTDKEIWNKYLELAAKQDSMRPLVIAGNKEVHYYKPIVIQPLCLSCHGSPGKEIGSEVLNVIDSLYPSDMAKGYKTGDLRGMWYISFRNKRQK